MSDPGGVLKAAQDAVLADPALQPEYDAAGKLLVTHCNQGLRRVAQAVGCHEFDDPEATADAMLAIMQARPGWRMVDGPTATIHALGGGLAVAGLTSEALGEAHGHVCSVCPTARERSNSLDRDVPIVANVGAGDPASPLVDVPGKKGKRTRKNWRCSVSWAFPCKRLEREPDYFVWG